MSSDPSFADRNPSPQKKWENLLCQKLDSIQFVLTDLTERLAPNSDLEKNIPRLQKRGFEIVEENAALAEFTSLVRDDLSASWLNERWIDVSALKEKTVRLSAGIRSKSSLEQLDIVEELKTDAERLATHFRPLMDDLNKLEEYGVNNNRDSTKIEDRDHLRAFIRSVRIVCENTTTISKTLTDLSKSAGAARQT